MFNKLAELLVFLRDLHVPERRRAEHSINESIKRLSHLIREASPGARSDRPTKQLERTTRRKRIIEESILTEERNMNGIHRYVSKRMNTRDDLAVLIDGDGNEVTDDTAKAELLRDHFAKLYPEAHELEIRSQTEAPRIDTPDNIRMVNSVDTPPENLYKHLRKLKSKLSVTPDNLPSYIYKQCGFEICIPLSILFERSLNDECLPSLFKTAIVAAVHKKGDRTRPDNKRNVSLTCTPSKLFESVIAETIYSNADAQGLIDPNQFAYRPGRPTVLQLLIVCPSRTSEK